MIQSISGMGGGMMGMQGAQGRPGPEQSFNKLDADGDGILSTTELQTMADMMAEKMGENGPSSEDIMAKMDSDGDGALSFAEFAAGRPQGRSQGGPGGGMMASGRSFGGMEQMDLSSLFSDSEEDSESLERSLISYA
ncbi:MAG: EF-hand domain-containing protein [Gemmatimonadales bacterium]|nr:EF-hand domain-containing protein [Gemmatimonadales bacterium]